MFDFCPVKVRALRLGAPSASKRLPGCAGPPSPDGCAYMTSESEFSNKKENRIQFPTFRFNMPAQFPQTMVAIVVVVGEGSCLKCTKRICFSDCSLYSPQESSGVPRETQAVWTYDSSPNRILGEQSFPSKYWLSRHSKLPALPDPKGNPLQAAKNGFEFYKRLQMPDGHWSGEFSGPLFLTPGLVIACYITKTQLAEEVKIEIARRVANEQRQGQNERDQGWGLHTSGKSTVFGTALNYVACRLLGIDAEQPMMVRARATLHALGGATGIPTWGKVWLALLGVYNWEGVNPVPPELWLLPEMLPFHPWRWWVHSRQVYLPISYLYGKRLQVELDPTLASLRHELYTQPYESINWPRCRNLVAKEDLYSPRHPIANGLFWILGYWEKICPSSIRNMGLNRAHKLCKMEDEDTDFIDIAPVNKVFNLIVCWDRYGPDSEEFRQHQIKLNNLLWMNKDGMGLSSANGSQLWDLGFITQALVESGLAQTDEPSTRDSVIRALEWIDRCQMLENPKYLRSAYRHQTKGAWPFGTKNHGYTVSDCTAEALKSVLCLQEQLSYTPKLVSKERLCLAVDVILSLQNPNGGFASYELVRGPSWLEYFSPGEVFDQTMIEVNYTECTTACLTAMSLFNSYYPDYRAADISRACEGAIKFVHSAQRGDGSWYGSWGVCFTYATMFALESLSLNNESYNNSLSVRKACRFLLDRQMADGGWGESFESCEQGVYIHHQNSQVFQTAWAILALLAAKYPEPVPIKRACRLIISRQTDDGQWLEDAVEGVFNKTTSLTYPNYKFAWSIYALGKAHKQFPDIKCQYTVSPCPPIQIQ
ncbi:hypothetical protein PCANC_26249 [Puccinia coronata f. sp. avenae]|uniref:Terpene cyclase/mutase family member n=1 Tax=Puccinia coronata f. sp. avenae TaxID=200324 RepID=A0A2N5S4I0_9BASI|nr:hypothetical protein PCANC_26249 [Puccinia coronata f. sp. avenae]